MWLGEDSREASRMFGRALQAGLTVLRAMALAQIASIPQCYAFRSTIAEKAHCSVRTTQRAINQGRAEGLICATRHKPGDKPPRSKRPLPCGFSVKWVVARGQAPAAVEQRTAEAKARYIVLQSLKKPAGKAEQSLSVPYSVAQIGRPSVQHAPRRWTAEEIEAEEARRRALHESADLERGPPE
jgi:hypothetical protein